MVEMGLEGLKSLKLGIWGQNNIVLILLGPKKGHFGASEAFF